MPSPMTQPTCPRCGEGLVPSYEVLDFPGDSEPDPGQTYYMVHPSTQSPDCPKEAKEDGLL